MSDSILNSPRIASFDPRCASEVNLMLWRAFQSRELSYIDQGWLFWQRVK